MLVSARRLASRRDLSHRGVQGSSCRQGGTNFGLTAFSAVFLSWAFPAPSIHQGFNVPLSRSNLLRLRLKPGSTEVYGFAIFCVALASLIRCGAGLLGG